MIYRVKETVKVVTCRPNTFNFIKKEARNFIKKETLVQVFPCEFCQISRTTFFTEHLWTTASEAFQSKKRNEENELLCFLKKHSFRICVYHIPILL